MPTKKRSALHCERLEQRELPANSFRAAILPVDLVPAVPLTAPAAPSAGYFLAEGNDAGGRGNASLQTGLSSDAVGAFFAGHSALDGLLEPAPALGPGSTSDGSDFESLPSSGWDAESISTPSPAQPETNDADFWAFLRNYATKAIRREELVRGPLPDHADIVQQIYVEWREKGPSGDDVHARVLDRNSPERSAFRGAVRRVLDRTSYDVIKRRGQADVTADEPAVPAPARDWADLEIDLAQGVGRLTERERDILDLRRWGMTFEEIGTKLGMSRQRVFEAYTELLDRLSTIYQD
jgi:DNA-directed RNA polymerase specialized sigma24 family protein